MGFYDKHILPRLLNGAMSAKPISYQRRKVVPRAEGRVLEIGFGAGHNLPFYDASKVERIWALEPSAEMRERSAARRAASTIPLEFIDLPSEKIPLEVRLGRHGSCHLHALHHSRRDGCARRDAARDEADRHMIFCEHGEAPDESVRRWQRRITPVWKVIGGGCHVGRQIPKLIRDSGFKLDDMQTMYLPGTPRFAGFNYWGSATKA